jgi:hypothetical protein
MRDVVINEAAIGYQFLRFFGGVENALYSIYRMGHLFFEEDQLREVKAKLGSQLKKMEESALNAYVLTEQLMEIHDGSRAYRPTYAAPAISQKDVQLRTPQSMSFLNSILVFDEVLGNLHTLSWFGEYDDEAVTREKQAFREEMRATGMLIALAAKDMHAKAEVKAVKKWV